jgi:hypothetical protein
MLTRKLNCLINIPNVLIMVASNATQPVLQEVEVNLTTLAVCPNIACSRALDSTQEPAAAAWPYSSTRFALEPLVKHESSNVTNYNNY